MKYNKIISLKNKPQYINKTKIFLMKMIKSEYGYDYIESYHKDIKNLKETYLTPKNNFYIILNKSEQIIGSIGIRGYDKEFKEFENIYKKDDTSSIWRMFINKNYRRKGLGSTLVKIVEKFSKEENYNKIYLHTHRTVKGALSFWESLDYKITLDTHNELETVHMEKNIVKLSLEKTYRGISTEKTLI